METKICSNCGKAITRNDPRPRKNYFCNFICKAQWQSKQPPEAHPRWIKERFNAACDYCGKPTWVRPSKIKRDKHHFCCKKHADTFKTGKSLVKPSGIIYTSRRKRISIACHYCGKVFEDNPCRLKDRKHVYCSMKCRDNWRSENESGKNSHAWRGGHKRYYGENWKKQRDAARKRDKYTCQDCGVTEKDYGRELDVHHKKPFITFGYIPGGNENYKQANRLENLITLCSPCHHKAEPPKILFQMQMFGLKAMEVLRSAKRNRPWKRCGTCKKIKPISFFHKSKNTLDGYHGRCKQCRHEHG